MTLEYKRPTPRCPRGAFQEVVYSWVVPARGGRLALKDSDVSASPRSSNCLFTLLALVLIVLVVGAIFVLVTQYNLLNSPTPVPATARPVQVTRVVPGTDLTARAFPTLPPEWTVTPSPTTSPTQPTLTPSKTESPTITPTFPPTKKPAPTATGPTPTRRPTWTPRITPSLTLTPTLTLTPSASATAGAFN
jgi:hypothetical protein